MNQDFLGIYKGRKIDTMLNIHSTITYQVILMKKLLIIGLVSTLIGCSTTSGTGARTNVSNFDGTKSVIIAPHSAACKSMICPLLGATWLDTQPNNIGFSVELLNEIAIINSVAFNIDGEIIKIDAPLSTDFNQDSVAKSSRTVVVTRYIVLKKILQSKRTWMRLSTSKGNYEVAIIDGSLDSKAYNALKRFDAQVNTVKK